MRTHSRFRFYKVPAAGLVAAAAWAGVAHAQAGPPGGPQDDVAGGADMPHHHLHHPTTASDDRSAKPVAVSGTVAGYNRDPHGRLNGLFLKDGDHLVQLNVPPDWSDLLAAAAPVNESVQATAVPERVVGDRTIDRIVSLSGHGKTLTATRPGEERSAHVDGTVASLNYSPRGEMDGALLDTGDFVHINPHAAASLNLATGQKLAVDGRANPTSDGHQAIEAETVNGTTIPRPPDPMDGGRGEQMGRGEDHDGPDDDDGPGGDGHRTRHGPMRPDVNGMGGPNGPDAGAGGPRDPATPPPGGNGMAD